MTVAVIGTGIAGLTAARLLDRTHDVTRSIEADRRVGGHTNTIRVDDPRGERWVDTGFIVHNDRNYPHFTAAARRARGRDPGRGDGDVDRLRPTAGSSSRTPAAGLFAQRSNLLRPRFWGLIRDQLRFNREVRPLAGRRDAPTRRRVPARFGLLALVSRARDRPRDLSGLVGRPGRRSGSFRSASSPSSSRTTASFSSLGRPHGGRSPAARASTSSGCSSGSAAGCAPGRR